MTLCTFISFLFGYHVHEKAILMITVPWTILFVANHEFERRMFVFLVSKVRSIPKDGNYFTTLITWSIMHKVYFIFQTTIANLSLFPLLFREEETIIKVSLHGFYIVCCIYCQNRLEFNSHKSKSRVFSNNRKEKAAPVSSSTKEAIFSSLTLVRALENIYLMGSILVFIFPYLMPSLMDRDQAEKFTFLPLLGYSIYCACGNMYLFSKYYWEYISS